MARKESKSKRRQNAAAITGCSTNFPCIRKDSTKTTTFPPLEVFRTLMNNKNRTDYEIARDLKDQYHGDTNTEVRKIIEVTYDELMKLGAQSTFEAHHYKNATELAIDDIRILGKAKLLSAFKMARIFCCDNYSIQGYWLSMILKELESVLDPEEHARLKASTDRVMIRRMKRIELEDEEYESQISK
ncbi:MAG: hypothetical protein ABR981_02990 [Candidatus Micrarchaeaceae archaeon]|jgi:DMSO/TMAO reductase YedYZ molybdopterin-dependent catalytic subunit